jgi:aryl carrier-like protein
MVAQCIGNDEWLYKLACQAKDALEIKEAVESLLEEEALKFHLTSALIQCALDQVNWQEIWEEYHQQC